jgi:hypothetical protein
MSLCSLCCPGQPHSQGGGGVQERWRSAARPGQLLLPRYVCIGCHGIWYRMWWCHPFVLCYSYVTPHYVPINLPDPPLTSSPPVKVYDVNSMLFSITLCYSYVIPMLHLLMYLCTNAPSTLTLTPVTFPPLCNYPLPPGSQCGSSKEQEQTLVRVWVAAESIEV